MLGVGLVALSTVENSVRFRVNPAVDSHGDSIFKFLVTHSTSMVETLAVALDVDLEALLLVELFAAVVADHCAPSLGSVVRVQEIDLEIVERLACPQFSLQVWILDVELVRSGVMVFLEVGREHSNAASQARHLDAIEQLALA